MGRRKSKFKYRKPKNEKEIPAGGSSSSAPPPPWIELPRDLTANILQRLGAAEILENAQRVCTTWRRVCQEPSMWRVIDLKNPGCWNDKFHIMCRIAVDRSQGQLIDLSMDYFGDDKLLNYIIDRSSQLRRLKFDSCYDISGNALAEAFQKLPNLEELHFIIMPSVHAKHVEKIGTSCPMLKSFTFNERGCKHPLPEFSDDDEFMEGFGFNDYAFAIAKTMPNLRQLQLFAHCMKNEGLQAILDGCPHLESLDLRQCFDLDLEGDLGKRCCRQIKVLKRPSDSISDIWWLFDEPSVEWNTDRLSEAAFSDVDDCFDYGYYDDFEFYDDYTSPSGIGFFGDDGSWFFDHDYF